MKELFKLVKAKIPLTAALGLLSGAVGFGGVAAMANQRQVLQAQKVEEQGKQIDAIKQDDQHLHEQVVGLKTDTEWIKHTLERIEQKLDRR